jgi:hypothetical protein
MCGSGVENAADIRQQIAGSQKLVGLRRSDLQACTRGSQGIDQRTLVRNVMLDACSSGEVSAISCPVAGRARKGAGRMRPRYSTV